MSKQEFVMAAFSDEALAIECEGVTVENRVDEVAIYGETSIPRSREGLRRALFLRSILDAAIAALEADANLPDVAAPPAEPVERKNPFGPAS